MKSLLLAVGMSVPNERQHRSSVDAGALRKNDNDDIYIYIEPISMFCWHFHVNSV